ncbi:MAG TPA: RidA family protein [Burkholderiales bacterium]|nr:RidA family protein [Burkholderiales bacterium]
MRLKIFPWLGQEFVSLSWEGSGNGTVEDETRELLMLFAERLRALGLGLDDVVRTRMFTRDMDSWLAGNQERRRILTGKARSVSSSHIWTERLGPKSRVSIDLLAMYPPATGAGKVMKEYVPEVFPLRSLALGGILFLSGVTDMTHATLDEQFPVIIQRLTDNLNDGGASWRDVERASFLLHHEESLPALRARFRDAVGVDIPSTDYTFVGTRQGKRLEVELTARLRS